MGTVRPSTSVAFDTRPRRDGEGGNDNADGGPRDRELGEWDHDDENLLVTEHIQGGPAAPMTRSEAAVMRAHIAALDAKLDLLLDRLGATTDTRTAE